MRVNSDDNLDRLSRQIEQSSSSSSGCWLFSMIRSNGVQNYCGSVAEKIIKDEMREDIFELIILKIVSFYIIISQIVGNIYFFFYWKERVLDISSFCFFFSLIVTTVTNTAGTAAVAASFKYF